MRFVHPEILWALGALSIPILVHLFNFRKFRRVYFSNVAFLREIQVETQSKSKLKHLLILLMRMLALTCIVLAFAQPFIPLENTLAGQGDRAVSVYLDNSFSMEAQSGGVPLFDIARNKAIEVVNSFQPTDKFQVLTNDFEGRHQRLISRDEAVELLQEVEISPSSRKISEVFARQRDVLNTSTSSSKAAFLFSDFQEGMADVQAMDADTSIALRIVPTTGDPTANISVDSLWFDTPVRQYEQQEIVRVRLTNTGDEPREQVPVKLIVNGRQKAVTTADVPARGTAETELTFTHTDAGICRGQVQITDYPISFDDTYYFGYEVLESLSILGISENTNTRDQVWAVFGDDPYFRYTSQPSGQLDYAAMPRNQLIVANQLNRFSTGLVAELAKFATNGGSVCIIPSPDADFASYNQLLAELALGSITARTGGSTEVSSVDYSHELFAGTFERMNERVDLPRAMGWYSLSLPASASASAVMTMRNGFPFLTSSTLGAGRAYFFSVPLDPGFSNLASHAFFPSSMLRMALLSAPSAPPACTLGSDGVITLRNTLQSGESAFRLKDEASGYEFIPEHRNAGGNTQLFVHSDMRTAGAYSITGGEELLGATGFNFSRAESSTEMSDPGELVSSLRSAGWLNASVITGDIQTIGAQATELEEGRTYWWTMVIWALIFLAAEVLLIKYWR